MKKRLHTHRYALILMLMALAACHSRVDRGKSPAGLTEFISGADLSYVNQVEEPAWITSRLRDQWGRAVRGTTVPYSIQKEMRCPY